MTSQEFHDKYFDNMYDKIVKITFTNGTMIRGLFNDEFFEDNAILVSCQVIFINDIATMELCGDKL